MGDGSGTGSEEVVVKNEDSLLRNARRARAAPLQRRQARAVPTDTNDSKVYFSKLAAGGSGARPSPEADRRPGRVAPGDYAHWSRPGRTNGGAGTPASYNA